MNNMDNKEDVWKAIKTEGKRERKSVTSKTPRKRKLSTSKGKNAKPKTRKAKGKAEVIDLSSDDEVPKKKVKTESLEEVKKENVSHITISDEDVASEFDVLENIKKEKLPSTAKCKTEINTDDIKLELKDYELLAHQKNIKLNVSKNIIKLFEEGNTIPFIARYRRHVTENMSPEMLREVHDTFEEICQLKQKIQTVIKSVNKTGSLNPQLAKTITSVRSMEELEIIYAPFKPGRKRLLAERAKDLGLETPALNLLFNTAQVNISNYVNPSKKELNKLEDVQKGIIHIISQVIATDSEVLSYLRKLRREANFMLESKKSQAKVKTRTVDTSKKNVKQQDESKFENYFDSKVPLKYIKPHQILAINRGEHHKILSVKIVVPDLVSHKFSNFCYNKWGKIGRFDSNRANILNEAIKDCYQRLIQPLITREIRAELKTVAEKASYEVFSKNLKHLLLAAPLKGQSILAIDPGYAAGCKLALVSQTGSLLSYDVIYPSHNLTSRDAAGDVLKNMLIENKCSLIALGNGTACRETEEWLTELIKERYFHPLDVKYTIVNEDGASIYSCNPEAKKEFPELDTNIISAVSLARRIQDPMAELVKIEPQHLGVGMYQHDLKKKTLEEALNEVVSECVSFVGVDLNTASQCLLRRIAGLSGKRATQIIAHREKIGQFLHRKQLTEVFGIGPRIFEQCAGFLRVGPSNAAEAAAFYKRPKTTKFDCTYIHPESYDVATKLLKKFKLKSENVGEPSFINSIKSLNVNVGELSEELDSTEETVKLILEALGKPLNYDLRSEVSQVPLFRKSLTNIYDLTPGDAVSGRVRNVTHFGCFVDIGVGIDGLIHNTKLNGIDLQIGNRVEANVISLDIARRRIRLEAVEKL